MNNIPIVLSALILLLNVGLFMQVRKQGEANSRVSQAIETLTSGAGGTDPAMVAEITKIVKEELAKTVSDAAADDAKLKALEARLETVQKAVIEKMVNNQDSNKKEQHLRELATKMKDEVLAICGRR